jgi:glycolate oxidase FAD binding subunit
VTTSSPRQTGEATHEAARATGIAVLRSGLPKDRERDPAGYPVEGRRPAVALAPRDRGEVAAALAAADRAGLAVVPQARRHALAMGAPLARYDVALDLTALDRIVEYEPADLTLTVEAGVTLGGLATRLAEHGQQLPLDPPGGQNVSIGGLLATGRSGAWRGHLPGTRDLLLGVTVALPDGTLARSGGRVVKNVAGYDLHRLHTGALGAFGVIVEAAFKLVPLPERTATVACRCAHLPQAAELASTLRHTPLAARGLALLGPRAARATGLDAAPHVLVGLAGGERALARSLDELRRASRLAHVPHAEQLADEAPWDLLAELAGPQPGGARDDGVSDGTLPTSSLGALVEEAEAAGFAAWAHVAAGSLLAVIPMGVADADRTRVAALRARCEAAGGALAIEAGPPDLRAALDPTGGTHAGVALDLARELRRRFDPRGTVNPGRWPGLDAAPSPPPEAAP